MIEPDRAAAARLSCRVPGARVSAVLATLWLSFACDRVRDEVARMEARGTAGSGGQGAGSSAGAAGAGATGEFVASVSFIYWSFQVEADYPGPDDTVLTSQSCSPLANVPADFAANLCIEGSGRLVEGSVVNFDGTCTCGYQCLRTGTTVCFVLLDPAQFPWGVGSASTPIVPLRSLTVDESLITHGTVLYTPAWDGVSIPAQGGVGGFVHDGCFRADDAGYGITGNLVALAAGPTTMFSWLEATLPSGTETWDLYRNTQHCAYLAAP
jgi:hypothetical protein